MHTEYTERYQYSPWLCNRKNDDGYDANQKSPNNFSAMSAMNNSSPKYRNHKYALGTKSFSFDEFVNASRKGHPIKRFCCPEEECSFRFLVIDIDNNNDENVLPKELDQFVSDTFRYTPGSSGKPYKYHLFIFLEEPVHNKEEMIAATQNVIDTISVTIGRNVTFDKALCNVNHIIYGCSQPELRESKFEILANTEYFACQICKWNDFKIIKFPGQYNQKANKYVQRYLMPYNTKMLLDYLNQGSDTPILFLEGKRFDIIPPLVFSNKKVQEGRRFPTAKAWIYKLVPMLFRCNWLGLYYTYEDMAFTFKHLCETNFDGFDLWWDENRTDLELFLHNVFEQVNGDFDEDYLINSSTKHPICIEDYSLIEKAFNGSTVNPLYRCKNYCKIMTEKYCFEHGVDGVVSFLGEDNFKRRLPHVSYKSFCRYLPAGYSIDMPKKTRSDNGSGKYGYLLNDVYHGVVYYVKERDSHEAKYLEKKGIRYRRGDSLYFSLRETAENAKWLDIPKEMGFTEAEVTEIYLDLIVEQEFNHSQ